MFYASVDEAIRLMSKAHVHMKLVVDHDEHFLGIVSMDTLKGENTLKAASPHGVSRADLTVGDVMVRRNKLHALSYEELQRRTIGDVLETLKNLGENHILVLDEDKKRICGVISANDMAKFLHAPVEIVDRAASFVDIVKALSH